ncbi:DUF6082 family protein [Micromonospora sp. NPDC049891]|uniref:DUF6082 family protein n=1 Tax=Micromonospora sp. NPDC049891 TaxID=3155655 RepID=UPI0034108078
MALAVGLIGLSPLAMTWLADLPVQWSHLSDMGQAYGGTSAVLSGLALVGVSASLLMQSSLNRISQLHSIRQRQFDIVKLALDNPEYLYVDGSAALADPDNHLKVYANLFVSHWAMVWDLAEMREDTLHVVARRLFESAVAREWWEVNGQSYYSSRRRRKFVAILSDECDRAARSSVLSTVPATVPSPPELASSTDGRSRTLAVGVVAAIGVGILLRSVTRRRRAVCLLGSRS